MRRYVVHTFAAAGGVAFLGAASSVIRSLPILLTSGIHAQTVWALLRGVAAFALELSILVGLPLGWTLAAASERVRGEARARQSLGESPTARIGRLWPLGMVASLLLVVSSLTWGQDAFAPGHSVTRMIESARVSCQAEAAQSGADRLGFARVPLLPGAFVCSELQTRWLFVSDGFVVTSKDVSVGPLLDVVELADAHVMVDSRASTLVAHVANLSIRGLDLGLPASSLSPWARAVALTLAALGASFLAARAALTSSHGVLATWALALSGPVAALGTLRLAELSTKAWVFAVPFAAGLAVTLCAAGLNRLSRIDRGLNG